MSDRIHSIELIRGIAMLGVVGIHTGSLMTSDPSANIHLFGLLEIVSRFSVPIFFFVSAFSLFRQYPLDQPLDIRRFYGRRFLRVLLPYLIGSVLYMLHYSQLTGDWSIWYPILIYQFFGFGMASYQLYFLVILLWFYLLMPLWRQWTRTILKKPFPWLTLLLAGQIGFNYFSSYWLRPDFNHFYLNLLIQYRMSWWTVHYLFVFLLGAVFATRYDEVIRLLLRNTGRIRSFFLISLGTILTQYYFLVQIRRYSLEQAVNTVHQLSPAGIFYTLSACFYFMLRFSQPLPRPIHQSLSVIGRNSYGIFWVHTLVLHYLHAALEKAALPLSVPITVGFYFLTVALSLLITRAAAINGKKFF